ncbi:MAG: phenylalanine--tRNA ligase subunit beta, partial [Fusobacteriaceae bacterium]
EELANEEYRIGIALSGRPERSIWNPKSEAYDFYSLKGYVEILFDRLGVAKYNLVRTADKNFHSGRAVDVSIGKDLIGTFGEIHPDLAEKLDIKKERVYFAEFNLTSLQKYMSKKIKYERIVKYPEVTRDLAIILDDSVFVGDMMNEIRKTSSYVESVNIFDVYKGSNIPAGKKSVAISFVLRNKLATLEEKEITEVTEKILAVVNQKFGGKISKDYFESEV